MRLPIDVVASLVMAVSCLILLGTHRWLNASRRYRRVMEQGSTFFLGLNLMNAGYAMLQPLVRWCVREGVTPAAVTWSSLLPAAGAALGVATGHWGIAAWCLLASALSDVLDGAVARETGHMSAAGAVLDSVLDRYAEFIFFGGLFIWYRDNLAAQLVVLGAVFGSFLITYSSAKAEALRATPPRGPMKRSDRLALLVVACAVTPLLDFWLQPAESRFAWPVLVAVAAIAVLANLSAVQRFVTLARSVRAPARREPAANGANRAGGRLPRSAVKMTASRRDRAGGVEPNPGML